MNTSLVIPAPAPSTEIVVPCSVRLTFDEEENIIVVFDDGLRRPLREFLAELQAARATS